MSTVSPPAGNKPKVDHEILHQNWFKSVGPRTYAVQVKKAGNGNHFLVLTEGKREESGEVRKTRLFLYSEDFAEFFKMLHETAVFIREHPVPDAIKKRQDRRWAKQREGDGKPANRKQATESNHPAARPGAQPRVSSPRPDRESDSSRRPIGRRN